MSWDDTHRRWRVTQQAETSLLATGLLPWHPDWAALFGEPLGLVAALRRRLTQRLEAQLDPALDDAGFDERWTALAATRWALERLDAVEDGQVDGPVEDQGHADYALAG